MNFIGFAPDLDPTTEGVITSCENVIPSLRGMVGAPSLVDVGLDALDDDCIGAAGITLLDGSRRVLAGTADALYSLSTTSWADVSRATAYTATSDDAWDFAQFGNAVIATNAADKIQVSTGGDFADISDAPVARHIVTAAGFVVAFDINDARVGGERPDAWWSSGIYDYETWTPDVSNLASYGYLMDTPGGIIGARKLGDNIIAYKRQSMFIGQYAGETIKWRWFAVAGEVGAISDGCIIDIGTAHLFIGQDDFYLFDGSQPVPIGSPIKRWFSETADPDYKHKTSGVYDKDKGLVWWFFSATGNNGALTDAIVYHLQSKRWGRAKYNVQTIFQYITPDITWDEWPPGASTTFDGMADITYDSATFNPGSASIAVFQADKKAYTLSGVCGESTIITGDFGDDSQYSTLTGVIPRYLERPTSASMTHYVKPYLDGSMTLSSTSDLTENRFDALYSGRYHRLMFNHSGDFEMVGFNPQLSPDGTQ